MRPADEGGNGAANFNTPDWNIVPACGDESDSARGYAEHDAEDLA